MNDDLIRRYGTRAVPRYTSYPTAADFTPAVGPADHARWLGELDPAEPVSLYLHVPYCRQLCAYCGCHTKAVLRDEPIEAYRASLEAEIRLAARHLPKRPLVARLAWGGGTPSILGAEGMRSVLDRLRDVFEFAPGFEHAIELDPRHLGDELAHDLAALGITRASLGVQDIDATVQEAIGRVQPLETVEAAVRSLRAAGVARLNLDLIYGLPHQTPQSLRRTCEAVAALGPDRIAAFGYAHLPARRANQRLVDASALPGPAERFALATLLADVFQGRGYQAIGIDHFARLCDPLARTARVGRLRRNFQGYTDDDCQTLIGFGASSISQFPGGFVQNESAVGIYRTRIERGSLATQRGHAATDDDRERASIIGNLMCRYEANLGRASARYVDEFALLRPLAADGLVELRNGLVLVTEAGRPFVRVVASIFDRFRAEATPAFSRAI